LLGVRYGASTRVVGVVFAAMGVLQAGSFLAAPAIAARVGMLATMVFTHLPSNLLLAAVTLAPSLPVAVGLLLGRTCLSQMDVPTRHAHGMALVPSAERTAAAGVTNTARYDTRPAGRRWRACCNRWGLRSRSWSRRAPSRAPTTWPCGGCFALFGCPLRRPPVEAPREVDHPRSSQDRPDRLPWLIRRGDPIRARRPGPGGREPEAGAFPRHTQREFTHQGNRCTFEVLIDAFDLGGDPAPTRLARIVHGADIAADLHSDPLGPGLLAIGEGRLDAEANDQWLLERGSFVYDALYAWCRRHPDPVGPAW
jgi:hypothetical protein